MTRLEDQLAAASAAPAEGPKWPACSRCRRTAEPGLECDADRCPWYRVDGVVALPS